MSSNGVNSVVLLRYGMGSEMHTAGVSAEFPTLVCQSRFKFNPTSGVDFPIVGTESYRSLTSDAR